MLACEALVDAEAVEQRRVHRVARAQLLHRIHPVIEELRGGPTDGLALPPLERIIDEAGRAAAADSGQMIARVVGVGIRAVAGQIAVSAIAMP